MDELNNRSIRPVSSAEVGDISKYDKSSLSGYKAESELKRIFTINSVLVEQYLVSKFKIPTTIKVRIEGSSDYDEFTIQEMLRSRVTDFDAKTCIKLYNIYHEKGLESLLNAIQYLSPLQKI